MTFVVQNNQAVRDQGSQATEVMELKFLNAKPHYLLTHDFQW